jgi:elongation of very long chain fatty acids protein 4
MQPNTSEQVVPEPLKVPGASGIPLGMSAAMAEQAIDQAMEVFKAMETKVMDTINATFGESMSSMWADIDEKIVGYFNPDAISTTVRQAAVHNWPLWRLDYAFAIACTYLAFVVAAKLLFDKGERPAAGAEKKKLTICEKIRKEGCFMFFAVALYNITQVVLCGWMVYRAVLEYRKRSFSLVCNVHDLAEDGLAFVTHCFYLSKALDFFDTLFMIIKGNWRQVSFLHVYHHFTIFLFYWLNAQCNYDGDAYLSIVLNGTIHFIMYGYYFATSFNITVPMFIKKSITNSQLTQFCIMETQGVALLVMDGCGSPRKVTILYMAYISTMLMLFLNFKRQNYKKPAKPAATAVPAASLPKASQPAIGAAKASNGSAKRSTTPVPKKKNMSK